MKLAIHQPQYLPWIHYFIKIKRSDHFVLLDTVNFQKNGIQNRNQIKTDQGKLWLTVPVKNKYGQKIKDVKISNNINWRRKHLLSLEKFYDKSKFFKNYKNSIIDIYDKEWSSLNELNIHILTSMMDWFGIKTPLIRSSDLNVSGKSTDLIINICKALNSDHYISGFGAKDYIDEDHFLKNNIHLEYLHNQKIFEYKQLYSYKGFIPDISALDILFNCGDQWEKYI
tara:strand:- start:197 stop:874 length:678 start_codon:yes stop_codon:yes gene_type:complete